MRIGIDAHHASELERALMPAPVKVEAPGIRVDLDANAACRTGFQDRLDINLVPWPTQQLAPGHVTENGCVRVLDSTNDPRGLFLFAQAEAAVYASNHEIKQGEDLAWIVE